MPQSPARTVAHAGIRLIAAGVAIQTVVHLVNRFTINRWTLDATAEFGLFAWASAGTTFTCAVLCVFLAALDVWRPPALFGLAAVLAFLSLDEAIVIHERVGVHAGEAVGLSESWDSVIWPLVYVPLLGACAALLVGCARAAPEARPLILGGLGMLAGAVAAEAITAPLSTPETGGSVPHSLVATVEEGLELGGWGLIGTALATWFALAVHARAV